MVITEVQTAVVSAAATATIVAAQAAGIKIRVVAVHLVSTSALSITFKSGAAGTGLTGAMPLAALGQLNLPFNPVGYFETAAATLLEMSLSASTQVGGFIQWVAVGA